MRNLILILFTIITFNIYAQDFQYGLQGGVNYNFSGDLTELNLSDIAFDDVIHKAKSIEGYHGGLWAKISFSDLFIKSELLYTQFKNEFSSDPTYYLTTKKIDIPVVLGMKILGPLYVFAGPDFQYIISENFSIDNTQVTYDDFTTGLHLGFGVDFGRLSLDLRWDKGLSESTSSIINSEFVNSNFTLDNRSNQLMLSLHYSLKKRDK